jgi:hypothetical protein
MRAAPELTLGEFVGEFDGLTSRQKRRAVTDQLGVNCDAALRETFGDGPSLTDVLEIYTAPCKPRRGVKSANNLDSTLGRIGKALRDGTKAYLDHYETAGADLTELAADLKDNGESVDG